MFVGLSLVAVRFVLIKISAPVTNRPRKTRVSPAKIIINYRAEQLLIIIYAMSTVKFLRSKIMIAITTANSIRLLAASVPGNQSSNIMLRTTRCANLYYFPWRSRCLRAFLPDAGSGNKSSRCKCFLDRRKSKNNIILGFGANENRRKGVTEND